MEHLQSVPVPPRKQRPQHRREERRQQSRQQQRARQRQKFNNEEASKIQKLFRIYPRRAVRQVLQEQSPGYSGTREAAETFLGATYSRMVPSHKQLSEARALFDSCHWASPSEYHLALLESPPTAAEIHLKLKRASNTAPGVDGLEYRHLRALDPDGLLMESIFAAVWRIGTPSTWRRARTIPIFKKGDTSEYGNFRPISLLPTIYKIFTGILSQRLTSVAVTLGWLSPEQKGFLPGVQGIQEHSHLLQTVIEEAKASRRNIFIAWLDLANAFGSVPHAVLGELFGSLPIPGPIKRLLLDVYSENHLDFVVGGGGTVPIRPTAGVRQGDALSCTIFNLAPEPLLRAAK